MNCLRTPREALKRFGKLAEKFPVSLPDRAPGGMGDTIAGDFRHARTVAQDPASSDADVAAALRPFGLAASTVPEKARDWDWGVTGLSYGDFLEAAELLATATRS